MVRMSDAERNELWDLSEAGESQQSIARALDRAPATVRTRLVSSGWRRPVPPTEWCSLRLSLDEREEISRGIARGESLQSVAERLGHENPAFTLKQYAHVIPGMQADAAQLVAGAVRDANPNSDTPVSEAQPMFDTGSTSASTDSASRYRPVPRRSPSVGHGVDTRIPR